MLLSTQRAYNKHIKPLLGERGRAALGRLIRSLLVARVRPFPTQVLGRQFERSRSLVEIDITYICNLNCFNCNRSCEQQPSKTSMSLGQVRHFLEESRERNMRWERIRVVGGEPTTHPRFLEVMELILAWRDSYSPETRIELTTNGHGDYVNRMLAKMPPGVFVHNSAKESPLQPEFVAFNVAPVELPGYEGVEFANGCPVTTECGIGVTPYGYYPCAIAGAIDRTFGFGMGRRELPDESDDMGEELRKFCSLCGHFKRHRDEPVDGPVMSPIWERAYARAKSNPPHLPLLPERDDVANDSVTASAPHATSHSD